MKLQERTETRKDLAEFLRSRRARIPPAEVGLSPGLRRRTPGLRREELAQLAGISVTWYTWLEQGRDIAVSRRALDGLARALRLDATERNHLFALAQHHPVDPQTGPESVSAQVLAVLHSISAAAYVMNGRWDVLAWNAAAERVFGDFGTLAADRRNLLWLTFTDPAFRERFVHWEQDAQRVLAKFRIGYARAGGMAHPAFRQLVDDLRESSPHFRTWWDRQDVHGSTEGAKWLRVSGRGEVLLQHTSFSIGVEPDLRLVVYTEADAPVPAGARPGLRGS